MDVLVECRRSFLWRRFGRHSAVLAWVSNGLVLGCSTDGCPVGDFAPPPGVLVFEDSQGHEICDLPDGVTIRNTDCAEDEDSRRCPSPGPADARDYAADPYTDVVMFSELCEARVAGWFDRDKEEPVELRLQRDPRRPVEDYRYQPVVITFDYDVNDCGLAIPRPQTVTLVAEE